VSSHPPEVRSTRRRGFSPGIPFFRHAVFCPRAAVFSAGVEVDFPFYGRRLFVSERIRTVLPRFSSHFAVSLLFFRVTPRPSCGEQWVLTPFFLKTAASGLFFFAVGLSKKPPPPGAEMEPFEEPSSPRRALCIFLPSEFFFFFFPPRGEILFPLRSESGLLPPPLPPMPRYQLPPPFFWRRRCGSPRD